MGEIGDYGKRKKYIFNSEKINYVVVKTRKEKEKELDIERKKEGKNKRNRKIKKFG